MKYRYDLFQMHHEGFSLVDLYVMNMMHKNSRLNKT